jgi:hypothetical protein
MLRLRFWSAKIWIVSLLAIHCIPCLAQAPTVEPVTDQETELGQAMYSKLKDNVEIIESYRWRRQFPEWLSRDTLILSSFFSSTRPSLMALRRQAEMCT